jgi:CBS domain-containing protein
MEAELLEVRDIMTYPAITEDEDVSVAEIAKCMKMSGISCVVITKEDNPGEVKAKEIMSSPLMTIESDASLGRAGKVLIEKGIRRLPVIENGELVGIVSLRNIVTREPLHVRKYLF